MVKLEELKVGMYLTYNDGVVECIEQVTDITKDTVSTITVECVSTAYSHNVGFIRTLDQKNHIKTFLTNFYTINKEYAIKLEIAKFLEESE